MTQVIGLDIGGSKITGAVFSGKRIIKSHTVTTPKSLVAFRTALSGLVDFLLSDGEIKNLGAGFPGAVDEKGKVVYAPNLPFTVGFALKDLLLSLGLKKIQIANDANCFALAELKFGQGRKLKNFLGITLGTGIGGGAVINGQLYAGARGSAGEIGHMTADGQDTYEHYFQKYRREGEYLKLGELLGRMLSSAVNLLDVEAIIFGGSVVLSKKRFFPVMQKTMRKTVLNKNCKPKFLISQLKNAGALGAALLFDAS